MADFVDLEFALVEYKTTGDYLGRYNSLLQRDPGSG